MAFWHCSQRANLPFFPIKGGKIHSWASCQKPHSKSVSEPEIEPHLIVLQLEAEPTSITLSYAMEGFHPKSCLFQCDFAEQHTHCCISINATGNKGWKMYIWVYNTFTIQNHSKRLTLRAGFNFEKSIWEPCVGFSGMEASTVLYWTQPCILRLPQFFHFVSQMHAVQGHPEASTAA